MKPGIKRVGVFTENRGYGLWFEKFKGDKPNFVVFLCFFKKAFRIYQS